MLRLRSILLGSVLLAGQTLGQEVPQPKLTVAAVDPPRGAVSDHYRSTVAPYRVQTEATYARAIDGTLPTDAKFTPPKSPAKRDGPALNGPMGIVLVFAVLIGGLVLWLRFGGSGALLAASPGDIRAKPAAPEGWKMPDTAALPSGDILALIQSMTDRRSAMVLLLRASLMRAAETTDTRFARSDTEREALRRLPGQLPARPILTDLLQQAELAHYGGRTVSHDLLAQQVDRARPLFKDRP